MADGRGCFLVIGLRAAACAVVATFGADAEGFAFFELATLIGLVFLTLALGVGFFVDADSSFFSVNSNAGLGSARSRGLMCVISAAGFTPAAAAALAAEADNADCFGFPSMSGFTIT